MKAYSPILVTEFGIVTDVKPLQPEKAQSPILVTEFGIVTDVKPMQSLKAVYPIFVTEFGIVIDVKLQQEEKAFLPILVTVYFASFTFIEDGIVMLPEYFLSPAVTSAVLTFETKL